MRELLKEETKDVSGAGTTSAQQATQEAMDGVRMCKAIGMEVGKVSIVYPGSTATKTVTGSLGGTASALPSASASIGGTYSVTDVKPAVTVECVAPASANSNTHSDASDYDWVDSYASYYDGGGGEAGCVQVDSVLPDGATAGAMRVGSVMQLGDEKTLAQSTGTVSFSQRKRVAGYRIVTISGVSLICSDTAPIATPDGLILAPHLIGKSVAVRRDEGDAVHVGWEAIKSVEAIGMIDVQHITVGDKCFWAGERPGSYILHHNMKMESSYDEIVWDDYDHWC